MASKEKFRCYDQIRAREVRVIDESGTQIGILPIEQALALAREKGLNLVEVARDAAPPVCRIMDFGKWKYQQKKKEHKAKQKQHQIVIKEIRVRPKTDRHDIETKIRKARGFLEKGYKVQITMLFRGREMVHQDLGRQIIESIAGELADLSKVERPPLREGRKMVMLLASNK